VIWTRWDSKILNRMVAAAVTQMHLHGASAEGEGEQLVPKADSEDWQPRGTASSCRGSPCRRAWRRLTPLCSTGLSRAYA
jgi:hypothetical protein